MKTTLIVTILLTLAACASKDIEKLPDGETYKLAAKQMECIGIKTCQKMLPEAVKPRAVEICGAGHYYLFDCQVDSSLNKKRDGTCLMRCGENKDTSFKE